MTTSKMVHQAGACRVAPAPALAGAFHAQLHPVNCTALSLTSDAPDRISLCTGRWRPAH